MRTIVDDDPRISVGDVSKKEGRKSTTTTFTFTVSLSVACDQPVTVSFKTTNGTATTSDTDYVAKTGSITFAPGETAKTVTINVKGDSKRESSELFYFDLFGKSGNSSLRKNHGIGTILNDDLYREWEEGDRDPYAHQAHRSVPTPSRRTVCAPGTTTLLSYRRPHLVTSLLVTSLKNGAK